MIKALSHATVFVKDQEEARKFYTEKLGFEVRTDVTMEGFRWLTVSPKGQSLELVLMEPKAGPMYSADTVAAIEKLLDVGALGTGVLETDDCEATYEELRARGVEFMSPPSERPYGIEAVLKDNSGNWFSLTERRRA